MSTENEIRPKTIEQIRGHTTIKSALTASLETGSNLFCFVGPSGVGKTTFAMAIAKELGIPENNQVVVNGGDCKVEYMRSILNTLRYRPLGPAGSRKLLVINEIQGLSASAWTALLQPAEFLPDYSYIVLTTTDSKKMPKAVVTRFKVFNLKPLKNDDLLDVLDDYYNYNQWDDTDLFSDSQIALAISKSEGSARQFVNILDKMSSISTDDDLFDLLEEPDQAADYFELVKALAYNKPPKIVLPLVQKYSSTGAETIRIGVVNYLSKVALSPKQINNFALYSARLEAYSTACDPAEGAGGILIRYGRSLYDE